MTNHTPEKVADLITEARSRTYTPSRPATLIARLADALEALEAKETHTPQHIWDKIAALSAERDEALAAIADIRREVEDFTQSDNDALCAIEHRLSSIPEHPKED